MCGCGVRSAAIDQWVMCDSSSLIMSYIALRRVIWFIMREVTLNITAKHGSAMIVSVAAFVSPLDFSTVFPFTPVGWS